MIKYFCDRCGKELSQYEFDNASQVTISGEDINDGLTIYKLCSDCEFAVRHFIKEKKGKVNTMPDNYLESLLHLLRYLIYVDKSWQCTRSSCNLCPYYSLNNGYDKNCSELKDTEKLAIICREAEKIKFEEGEYHDLQQL